VKSAPVSMRRSPHDLQRLPRRAHPPGAAALNNIAPTPYKPRDRPCKPRFARTLSGHFRAGDHERLPSPQEDVIAICTHLQRLCQGPLLMSVWISTFMLEPGELQMNLALARE